MKKIIYTRQDGGLSVVHPVVNTYPEREEITDEQALQRAWDRLPQDAINPQIVDESAIPQDRTFRNAWKHGGDRVLHDIEKCRDLRKKELREYRGPKLAALDVAYMRADEAGDHQSKSLISIQKKALRDITDHPSIKAAQSVEELKAISPEKFVQT